MAIPFNTAAIPGRHTIRYRIRDNTRGFPERLIDVCATPDEIEALARDGYLVRESLIHGGELERLRAAFDACVANDKEMEGVGGAGGIFLRHLMDKHPDFLEMHDFAPFVSVARAVLGPVIQNRGLTGRVCYPEEPGQQTEWHFHQRVLPEPLPPFFTRPHTLDVLLYLDDVNDRNGPLVVQPGSHQWTTRDLTPEADFADKPDQVALSLPAGSAVMTHGSLWHRAMPNRAGGGIRRLLIFGYGPCWVKGSIYGTRPENGLIDRYLARTDIGEESRELLGEAGIHVMARDDGQQPIVYRIVSIQDLPR